MPGYCSAVGNYIDGAAHVQAFVAAESKGKWDKAKEAPGLGGLNAGGQASLDSVSCAARGNCGAGGSYQDGSGRFQAFVVADSKGRWDHAQEVPGTAALNAGGGAVLGSVSCASAGDCSAGGYYLDAAAHRQAFVVTEKRGHWGKAEQVPGTGPLNSGGNAEILSLSCTSAGNCSAGGYYTTASHKQQALLVVQKKGTWGKAGRYPDQRS
jgi:hypothetical protein